MTKTTTTTTKAALWIRVSTEHQETDNQVPQLESFAKHHGYKLVKRYELSDSAWRDGKGGPEYRTTLKRAQDDAWRGEFDVLIVWSLDRIVRTGAEEALRMIRQFRERNCAILSVQESWLNGSPEVQDLLVAFAGWMAEQESKRRSERIKAGMQRRRAEGKPMGGAASKRTKDKKPRKTEGYVQAWARRKADAS
jgi:DNA invertase Pin-like site-specific DNA recombinase